MHIKLLRAHEGKQVGDIVDWPQHDADFLIDRGEAEAVAGGQFVSTVHDEGIRQLAAAWAAEGIRAFKPRPKRWAGYCRVLMSNLDPMRKVAALASFYEDGIVRKAAMNGLSGSTGSYILPVDFASRIFMAPEEGIIRPRATIIESHSTECLLPLVDSTSVQAAGVTPFLGGITPTWFTEGTTAPETIEPKFRQVSATLDFLGGFAVLNNGWLADVADAGLESYLVALFTKAIGWAEDYAFLQGSGAGQPQGILGAACSIKVARQNANAVTFKDVSTMESKLLPQSENNAIYVYSPTAKAQLLQLADGSNRAVFVQAGLSPSGKAQMTLLGRRAICTEKLPALGTTGDVMLIDPSFYVIADHVSETKEGDGPERSLAISWSNQASTTTFYRNQSVVLLAQRVEGRALLDGPVTLQDGATQVSPFVVLQ